MSRAGRLPAFRKLAAETELRVLRDYPRLLPRLRALGAPPEDAQALAWNCTLLGHVLEGCSPQAVLRRYSLEEIAELCEAYRDVAAGQLEYGETEGMQHAADTGSAAAQPGGV